MKKKYVWSESEPPSETSPVGVSTFMYIYALLTLDEGTNVQLGMLNEGPEFSTI